MIPKLYGNPREKFPCIKWLCNIIGGAVQEEFYLVGDVGFGAEYNDRDAAGFSFVHEPGEDFFTAQARKHQIQQDEVRRGSRQAEEGFRPRVSPSDGVAFPGEAFFQGIADINVIIYDQYIFQG